MPDTRRRLALSGVAAAATLLGLALAELALRLVGFEFQPVPLVQFGWPDPVTIERVYQPDPLLLWVTKDYAATLAKARRDPPVVVFMGDSCTEFGTYPRRTLARLREHTGTPVRGLSVATGGWTAVQGRWQLDRDVLPLRPRIVTIYFGWNDHWMALGPPDAELARGPWRLLAERLRLVQALDKARTGLAAREGQPRPRVELGLYERTLEEMVGDIRRAEGRAVLITAPSGHEPGHEPGYLQKRHLARLSDLIPLHASYVEATRRAARDSGAVLCDAAAVFPRLPGGRARYFRRDGIHFTPSGDEQMARVLSECIEQAQLLSR
jgi:lysophospholipase L1-like esterase